MANYTVATNEVGVHKTLVANTVDTVEFDVDDRDIEVLSRNGAAEVYFTVDGSTPTIGGDNCYVLPAGVGGQKVSMTARQTVVKLISSGAVEYSVTRA